MVILLPLRIGKGAIVGMVAVVTKDVPAGVTVIGNPARPLVKGDEERTIFLEEAITLMFSGIDAGMFSQPDSASMPKYIWAVSEKGEVFESKTHPNTPWLYHGYPITTEENFRNYILDEWKKRYV